MFNVTVITLVPALWQHLLGRQAGLVGRAFLPDSAADVRLNIIDLKNYGHGVHRQVDDAPFGGGAGMVLTVPPLDKAVRAARRLGAASPVCLLGPRGRVFDQGRAREFAAGPGITLICARYEGVDERVRGFIDDEISIGDMVLSAGDPAAWSIVDAIVRLLPGVLGNRESLREESFAARPGQTGGVGLEYPHYTRPAEYEGQVVPAVLRSGDHGAIAAWRREQALRLTRALRPDLLEGAEEDDAPK